MAMIVAIPKERRVKETRVAATPETVKKLKGLGLEVAVETGAGADAHFSDADYLAAGATIAPDAATALKTADIVLKVRGPADAEIALLKRGAVGSFHNISKQHLDRYCAEFSFRWDYRSITDSARTEIAIRQADGKRLTYRPLTAKRD